MEYRIFEMVRFFIPPPLTSPYGEAFSPIKGEILGRYAFADCFKFTPPSTGQRAPVGQGIRGRVKSYTSERRVDNG
ncbi:hypothetical protein GH141_08755 [bacterium]|nr:hypothetical protein [bacterium]